MATKKLRPVRPGDILRNDFLEPLRITSYRLAKELGVLLPTVTQLVGRRGNVTAEMALRLARYFGTSAQVWQSCCFQWRISAERRCFSRPPDKAQPYDFPRCASRIECSSPILIP